MTTATAALHTQTMTAIGRPSLEELVDRMVDALFFGKRETKPEQRMTRTLREAPAQSVHEGRMVQSVARAVHEARRLRQAGDLDGALAVLADADIATAETEQETRWAYAEWVGLAKRRFADGGAALYSPGTGRAAVLAPRGDGSLEVLAALGMRWQPGQVVSRRSLRGLKPLGGGAAWS